jgi:SAM-dependent methyltransferase
MVDRVRISGDPVSDARTAETMASRIQESVNGFVLTNALFACVDTHLAEELCKAETFDPVEGAPRLKLDAHQLKGLCKYLVLQDVLAEKDGKYWLTPLGKNLFGVGARGFLELYRGGYGHVIAEAGPLLTGAKAYQRDLVRDGKYVASGSTGFFRTFNFPQAFAAIDRCRGKRILDLGCGDASLLIDYCRRTPDATGIGVDVDERAISNGRAAIDAAKLSGRIKLIHGDAFDLKVLRPLADQIDVLTSFAMQHEMFRDGEQAVINHLNELATCFKGKRYVLGEPLINMTRADSNFFWVHVLSLQGFPRSIDGWVELLGKCKLELEAVYYSVHEKLSNSGYFVLKF